MRQEGECRLQRVLTSSLCNLCSTGKSETLTSFKESYAVHSLDAFTGV